MTTFGKASSCDDGGGGGCRGHNEVRAPAGDCRFGLGVFGWLKCFGAWLIDKFEVEATTVEWPICFAKRFGGGVD